jgi:hypothetical protein
LYAQPVYGQTKAKLSHAMYTRCTCMQDVFMHSRRPEISDSDTAVSVRYLSRRLLCGSR